MIERWHRRSSVLIRNRCGWYHIGAAPMPICKACPAIRPAARRFALCSRPRRRYLSNSHRISAAPVEARV